MASLLEFSAIVGMGRLELGERWSVFGERWSERSEFMEELKLRRGGLSMVIEEELEVGVTGPMVNMVPQG